MRYLYEIFEIKFKNQFIVNLTKSVITLLT